MTSFVHVHYPTEHPGVVRAELVVKTFKEFAAGFDGARAAASLMLAAIIAALVVVANELVETWTEGHLLAAWVVMWVVAFTALGLLATPARRAGKALRAATRSWSNARREAAHDEQLWRVALADARVMADISRAMSNAATRDIRKYY